MNDSPLHRRDSRKKLWLLGVIMPLALLPAFAQTDTTPPMAAGAHPSFEVATVKPSDPNDRNQGFHVNGHRIYAENMTMNALISFAYAVHPKQIVGGPAWFGTDRYDIGGLPDIAGEPSLRQEQEMFQKILADRFALKLHREKRELSVYAVTVAKGGSKLAKSADDPNGQPESDGNGRGRWKFENASMSDFTLVMQADLDRPIVDQTGLTGKYDFALHWTPDNVEAPDPDAPPGLFTAIQEQLGLKFEPVKAPADVLVIDHVEKPSAN